MALHHREGGTTSLCVEIDDLLETYHLLNAFGSIPFADAKSVPVFFSECIASRTACSMATQETSEKTSVMSALIS